MNPNECEFCHYVFATKGNLTTHQRTAKYCNDNKEKGFKCNECGKEFTTRYRQQEHACVKNKKKKKLLDDKIKEEQTKFDNMKNEYQKLIDDYKEQLHTNTTIIDDLREKVKQKDESILKMQNSIEKQTLLYDQQNTLISKLEAMLQKANQTIAEIAMQPKTTNNSDNRVHHQQNITNNFDINDIAKITTVLDKHLTTDVIRRGQEGVAEMLKTHLLQTETGEPMYECTDVARQKFEFRNADGNIETDPNATKLIRNLGKSGMWNKAHTTGKKLWETEDGTVNKDAQEVFMPRVTEVMEIGKDSTKLRRQLASITARQNKKRK